MAFVRTVFGPHAALRVHIRLVQAGSYRDHDDDALFRRNVAGAGMNRRAHVVAGGVAQLLVEGAHLLRAQTADAAIVLHAHKDAATTTVGQGHQFSGQTVQVVDFALELVLAVFATGKDALEFFKKHGGHCCDGLRRHHVRQPHSQPPARIDHQRRVQQ